MSGPAGTCSSETGQRQKRNGGVQEEWQVVERRESDGVRSLQECSLGRKGIERSRHLVWWETGQEGQGELQRLLQWEIIGLFHEGKNRRKEGTKVGERTGEERSNGPLGSSSVFNRR